MVRNTPRITLHVGLPKCASTSIQNYFANNYWKNIRQGVLYPKAGRSKGGYRSHQPLLTQPELVEERVGQILREARLTRARRILISSETSMGRLLIPESIEATRKLMDLFGRDNIDVLAISRPPGSLINSSYIQFLKGGLWSLNKGKFFQREDISIHGFLDFFNETWGFPLPEYHNLFPAFAEAFSVNEITELPLVSAEGDLLALVAKELGLKKYGSLPRKNSRRSYCMSLMLRDFQLKYGVESFLENKRTLNQLKMHECRIEDDEAVRLGLTLSREELAELDAGHVGKTIRHRF